MDRKVLFLDTVHPVLWSSLEKDGYICEDDYTCSADELLEKIGEYTGIVIRSRLLLTAVLLERATKLRFIARSGSGLENIDVAFAESRGIVCINSPEGNRDAVGEHAMALLLGLLNHIPRGDREVRRGIWEREKNRGVELGGKTVGLIGYGNTGSAFAGKLAGFDCRVIAYDKYKTGFSIGYVKEVDLDTLFAETDILSLHLPYNKETHYIINADLLSRFRKKIYLLNTSRGKLVKTEDLAEALRSGRVTGAGMDVLEYESHSFEKIDKDALPEAFRHLSESDKVILSPHVAGWTAESYYKLSAVLYEKIKAHHFTE